LLFIFDVLLFIYFNEYFKNFIYLFFYLINLYVELRVENEKYFRNHPELKTLLHNFICTAYEHRPIDITKFAVEYFVYGKITERDRLKDQKEI
jgi:hypothetical protein